MSDTPFTDEQFKEGKAMKSQTFLDKELGYMTRSELLALIAIMRDQLAYKKNA